MVRVIPDTQEAEESVTEESVCVQNVTSTTSEIILGVPQGSILDPLLFIMYFNDLSQICPSNVTCQMYADHALLYVNSPNRQQVVQDLSAAMLKISNRILIYTSIFQSKCVCSFLKHLVRTQNWMCLCWKHLSK